MLLSRLHVCRAKHVQSRMLSYSCWVMLAARPETMLFMHHRMTLSETHKRTFLAKSPPCMQAHPVPSTDGQMSGSMGGAVRGSPYGSQRGASPQFSQVRPSADVH